MTNHEASGQFPEMPPMPASAPEATPPTVPKPQEANGPQPFGLTFELTGHVEDPDKAERLRRQLAQLAMNFCNEEGVYISSFNIAVGSGEPQPTQPESAVQDNDEHNKVAQPELPAEQPLFSAEVQETLDQELDRLINHTPPATNTFNDDKRYIPAERSGAFIRALNVEGIFTLRDVAIFGTEILESALPSPRGIRRGEHKDDIQRFKEYLVSVMPEAIKAVHSEAVGDDSDSEDALRYPLGDVRAIVKFCNELSQVPCAFIPLSADIPLGSTPDGWKDMSLATFLKKSPQELSDEADGELTDNTIEKWINAALQVARQFKAIHEAA